MVPDLHHMFVPFHRIGDTFVLQCLVKISEFLDKKKEWRVWASMSRTQRCPVEIQTSSTSCFFSTVQCLLQPSLLLVEAEPILQCNIDASKCSCLFVMFSFHFIMDCSVWFMGTIKQIGYFEFIYEHVVLFYK